MQAAIRARDVRAIKAIWNRLVPIWDDHEIVNDYDKDVFNGDTGVMRRIEAATRHR